MFNVHYALHFGYRVAEMFGPLFLLIFATCPVFSCVQVIEAIIWPLQWELPYYSITHHDTYVTKSLFIQISNRLSWLHRCGPKNNKSWKNACSKFVANAKIACQKVEVRIRNFLYDNIFCRFLCQTLKYAQIYVYL